MGILASALSPMCDCLHWLLGSLWSRSTEQAASSSGQRDRQNQLHWAIQQYLEAAGVSVSPKNLVFFQILRESHRCYLVFYPSLQCIITCIALPYFFKAAYSHLSSCSAIAIASLGVKKSPSIWMTARKKRDRRRDLLNFQAQIFWLIDDWVRSQIVMTRKL